MRMRSSIGPWRSWSPYNVGVLLLLSTTKRVGLAVLGAVLIFGWTPSSIDGVQRLGVHERVFRARVHQRGTFDHHDQLAARFVQGLRTSLAQMLQDPSIADRDRVYFHLASDRLRHAYDGWGLTAGEWRRDEGRVARLLENLSRMLNSNENFQMDDTFHLSFVHVRAGPYGGGKKRKYLPGHQSSTRLKVVKKTVVAIPQTDANLCCARALVTAWAKAENHPQWRAFQRGRPLQLQEALELHQRAGVRPGPCGADELHQIARALPDYTLVVVDANRAYACFAYGRGAQRLGILHEDGHYDALTSLPGFFGKGYFCSFCYQAYNHAGQHACTNNVSHCGGCLQNGCSDYREAYAHYQSPTVSCLSCRRAFYGPTCLANHLGLTPAGKPAGSGRSSVCQSRQKCSGCFKLLRGRKEREEHRCGYDSCPACKEQVEIQSHRCFVQVAPPQDETTPPPFHVFFDIESRQEDGQHIPNLVVAETEVEEDPFHFQGETCPQQLTTWLDYLAEETGRPLTVLAHNFQGYDSYPLVEEYHRQKRVLEQTRNGAKILQLKVGDIRFIDSLSFFQMPLSAFPKTFGLTELKKGYFPRLFNTRANQDYVGPLPPKDAYLPDSMSVQGRQDFERWYADQVARGVQFDFQQELLAYCQSDVKLLKQGCLTFKRDFEALAHFNPFDQMTIASACNRDLPTNRVEADTIASEPLQGWRARTNHSHVAMQWLRWVEAQLDRPLQHARNKGEFRIPGTRYTVDGYDATTRTVYEFHGCYWHGCPRCHPQRQETHARLLDRTMGDAYRTTQTKVRSLRVRGYTVVEMWECDWHRRLQDQPQVADYVASLHLQPPLQPREAFFGGRTNEVQLHRTSAPGEEIRYYDYTSLYPWVNENARYPVGHPEFIYAPDTVDLHPYFGLAKCTVLPPPGLYHPVLPYRTGDKLTVPLCRTCVENQLDRSLHAKTWQCPHTDPQRALTGTWCTPELHRAVEQGYVVLKIHEVWHFPQSRQGLFAEYANTWLKIKEEASRWPTDCRTQESRAEHLHDYARREGIHLDYDQVQHKPGRRALAKMMLNSMWGKFGQRQNKMQVREFTDPQAFHDILDSDQNDIRYISTLTEDRVEVHYTKQDHCESLSPNLNIFVACFTTCWARLCLYEALQLLGEQVLYFDTDSVVFAHRPGQASPALGQYLGEFKDELGHGDSIVEFCSAGPKNYGYKTRAGKTVCKVRGFSLNCQGAAQLNYHVLRQNVLDELHTPLAEPRTTRVTQSHTIQRQAKDYTLHTRPTHKDYRLVCSKHVVDPQTAQSYPYGYQRVV